MHLGTITDLSSSLFLSQLSEADTDEHTTRSLSYRRARLIKSSKSQVHLITVGNSGVGKTQLLLKWCIEDFRRMKKLIRTNTTIGIDYFLTPHLVDEKNGSYQLLVQSWDTAGQETFRVNMKPYFKGRHGCMFVFAVNDKSSFENLDVWMKEMRDVNEPLLDPENPRSIIVANKADISKSLWSVSKSKIESFAKNCGLPVFYTSALNCTGINDAFECLCNMMIPVARTLKTPKRGGSMSKSGCC